MQKIILIWLLGIDLFVPGASAEAQQAKKTPLIGYLNVPSPADAPERYAAFQQGLRELGYVEGKNVFIEYRYADGKLDRLPSLVADLVRLNVDVIVSGGPTPTQAAKAATKTIPIVMAFDSDPVGNGFVASLARPGGNITGLSNVAPEISGKRLELLKESVPKLARVAVLGMSTNPGNSLSLKETELAARTLKLQLQYIDVPTLKDAESAFRAATRERAGAVLALNFPPIIKRALVVSLAAKNRLPAIYFESTFVEAGGLMSYGARLADLDRRAATYVDKILKGSKPADLPVEQPLKFEFIVNLRAAKQIGLTIPPNVLVRADRVIR